MEIQIVKSRMPKLLTEMTEEDKGEFKVMTDEDIGDIVKGLQINENIELGPEFNFDKVFDAQYYSEKFPGFEDFVYDILEQETIQLNNEDLKKPVDSLSETLNRHIK